MVDVPLINSNLPVMGAPMRQQVGLLVAAVVVGEGLHLDGPRRAAREWVRLSLERY
jgi:hypothetical protein